MAGMFPVKAPRQSALPSVQARSGGQVPDALRGDDQPLYDRQIITAATYRDFLFFNLGQGGAANRGYPDTNVPQPNKLPGEFTFSIRGIAVAMDLDVPEEDLLAISRAIVVIYKNDNRRFQLRVSKVGGGGGFSGIGQGAALPALVQNGTPHTGDFYKLKSWIPLQAEDNFNVRLEWSEPGQVIANDVTVEIILYGMVAGLVDRI